MQKIASFKLNPNKALSTDGISGWVNPQNGFGELDPNQNTELALQSRLGFTELLKLHDQDPLAGRYVDLRASDMTRKSFTFVDQDNSDGAEEIENGLKKDYDIDKKLFDGLVQAAVFGGSVLLMDIEDGGSWESPLNENNIKSIKSITVHNSYRCQELGIDSYYPIGHKKVGEPVHYRLNLYLGNTTEQLIVHESRIIPMYGTSNIDYTTKRANWGFSPSVYVKLFNVIRRYGVSSQATPSIIQNFTERVMMLDKLSAVTKRQERISFLRQQRRESSIHKTTLIGATDKLENLATPVTGISDITGDIRMDVSMSGGYPVSVLFSSESTGLGGGGHLSEERVTYYDTVASKQKTELTSPIDRLRYLKGLELGIDTEDMTTVFNPLHELSELDLSELRKNHTEADGMMIDRGFPAKDIWGPTYSGGEYNFNQIEFKEAEFDKFVKEQDELAKKTMQDEFDIQNPDGKEPKNNDE